MNLNLVGDAVPLVKPKVAVEVKMLSTTGPGLSVKLARGEDD